MLWASDIRPVSAVPMERAPESGMDAFYGNGLPAFCIMILRATSKNPGR